MSRPTALERHVDGSARSVGPLDALAVARRRFLRGEKIDMQEVAGELGVARATLYRWVGGRERLLGEVLWSLAQVGIRESLAAASGFTGGERVARFAQHFLELTAGNAAVERFLQNEPEVALRVLTSKDGVQHRRLIGALESVIREEAGAGRLAPKLDPADLAYVIIRVSESFIWRDTITGEARDVETPDRVVRLLVGA